MSKVNSPLANSEPNVGLLSSDLSRPLVGRCENKKRGGREVGVKYIGCYCSHLGLKKKTKERTISALMKYKSEPMEENIKGGCMVKKKEMLVHKTRKKKDAPLACATRASESRSQAASGPIRRALRISGLSRSSAPQRCTSGSCAQPRGAPHCAQSRGPARPPARPRRRRWAGCR